MGEAPDRTEEVQLSWSDRARAGLRFLLLVAVVVFLALALLRTGSPLEAGREAPGASFRSYDGKTWSLEQFRGRPIVVNFWATWCPPCLNELPHFAAASRRHRDEVVFIGAAVTSPPEDVFRIVDRFDIRYPIAAVDHGTVQAWNARGLPSTYFLDREHRVVHSVAGELTARELEALIQKHLGVGQGEDARR